MDLANLRRVCIDETAANRGHDHISIFVDIDTRKVVFVTDGRDAGTSGAFGDHVPMPAVYNYDIFGSSYAVYSAGSYDIDFGFADFDLATPGTDMFLVADPFTRDLDTSSDHDGFDGWHRSRASACSLAG